MADETREGGHQARPQVDDEGKWGEFTGGSVMVAVPSYHTWEAKTVSSFTSMMLYTNEMIHREGLPIDGFSFRQSEGTYLFDGRQLLAEKAIEQGSDWILWVDTDMRFPADSLIRLLSLGLPIVGANYATRDPANLGYVAIKQMFDDDTPSRSCITSPESTGVEEVEAIGFGLALTKTSVFDDMPVPWFFHDYIPNLRQKVGEDVWFCIRARQAGYKVHVDHWLSHHVGHVGRFEYKCEHAWLAVPEEDKVPTVDRRLVEV